MSTYNSWAGMKSRCKNPNLKCYKNYGGRGVRVCARWESYSNFLEDMGERPEGMSIDRIDNDGDYEPDNCRWATQKEQCSNKRKDERHKTITHKGVTLTHKEWSLRLGGDGSLVRFRIKRGWSEERAISTKRRVYRKLSTDG